MSDLISRRTFMRNTCIAAAAVAGAGVAGTLSACSSTGSNGGTSAASTPWYTPETIRVYHWSQPSETALFVAQEKGYFQKYGITAEMVKVSGDLSVLKSEKGNCIFQIMPHQFPQLLEKASDGVDARVMSCVHTGGLRAVCTRASGIESVADLPGKRVAVVSASNDAGQIALQAALADAGIDRALVNWIPEGTFDVALEELRGENVDACACTDVYAQIATTFFDMPTFYDTATDPAYKDIAYSYLAGNGPVYGDDELAGRVCAAVDEAGRWAKANVAEAAELIQTAGYVTGNKQLLVSYGVPVTETTPSVYELVLSDYTFGDGGASVFDRSLRSIWEALLKAGVGPSGKTVEDLCSSLGYYAL